MELMEKGVKELHQRWKEEGTNRLYPQSNLVKDPRSDSSQEDHMLGKPRRKVLKKKKQKNAGAKSSPRSMSMPENMSSEETMFDIEVTNSSEDDEVSQLHTIRCSSSPEIKDMDMDIQGTTSHRRMSTLRNTPFVTPFSEPETSPIGR